MTDPVTLRAEQALIGAMLTQPPTGPLSGVEPGSFADPRHQAIYAALTGTGPQPSGPLARLRAWVAALPWRQQVRDMRAYLDQLPGICPDSGHLDHYAVIVGEASRQRAAGAPADSGEGSALHDLNRLAGAATWLASQTRPAAAKSARQPSAPYAVARAISQQRASAPRTAASQQQASHSKAENSNQPPRPLTGADLEELVLAGLIRHPAEAPAVLGWLTADAFTGLCRPVYELIRAAAGQGLPPDPVILTWHARQKQTTGADAAPVSPDDVLRIAAIPAAPGTAAILGRALLADRVCTARFGPDWPERRAARERQAQAAPPAADQKAQPKVVPGTPPTPRPARSAAPDNQSPGAGRGRIPRPQPERAPSGPAPRM